MSILSIIIFQINIEFEILRIKINYITCQKYNLLVKITHKVKVTFSFKAVIYKWNNSTEWIY